VLLVRVKVYYFEVFGGGSISLELNEGATLKDVVNVLEGRFGRLFFEKTGKRFSEVFEKYFIVFLNGLRVNFPVGMDRRLSDGDELVLVRPVGEVSLLALVQVP